MAKKNIVAEQPVAEQPVAEQPVAEQPVAEQPVAEQPVAEQPVAEQLSEAEAEEKQFKMFYLKASKMSLEKALKASCTSHTWSMALLSVNMDRGLNDLFDSHSLDKINYILSVLVKLGRNAPMPASAYAKEFVARSCNVGSITTERGVELLRPDHVMLVYRNGAIHFDEEWNKKKLDLIDKWYEFFSIAAEEQRSLKGTRVGYLKFEKEERSPFQELQKAFGDAFAKAGRLSKKGLLSEADRRYLEELSVIAYKAGYLKGEF